MSSKERTMKKYLILYYSKSGNSKFLAEKLAKELGNSRLRKITPTVDFLFLVFLLSALKVNVGTGVSRKEIEEYEEIIIFGPVWGGLLISPLRAIIKKCVGAPKSIHFAVTCESGDDDKNGQYGYAQVLEEAKKVGGNFIQTLDAFPTSLVLNESQAKNRKLSEKILLTAENFKGAIASRLGGFVKKIKSEEPLKV